MSTRQFRWLFAALATASVVIANLLPAPVSVSAHWENGRYEFAGGTSPWALGFSAFTLWIYILLMDAAPVVSERPVPGLVRRFVAFWLDSVLATTITAPLLGIPPVLTEWTRTGTFRWDFQRTSSDASDITILLLSVVLDLGLLLFYYAVPVARGRPSPGACIAGYQVLPDAGTEMTLWRALARTSLGFVAVAGACLAPFVNRQKHEGKFWLDRVFHTRALALGA
jgi:hypothetical protein